MDRPRLVGEPSGKGVADVVMLGQALVVLTLQLLQAPPGAAPPVQPVAIVSAISGSASMEPKPGVRKALALYDWIKPDTVVDVAAEARVELIMIDGRRYTLGAGARARLSSTSLTRMRGSVTEESAMPRLLALAPIAGQPPRAAGAVRMRAIGIARINPCEAVLTLRDETVLRFEPIEGAPRYEIEIRTGDGGQVFARTIDRPPLTIPAGVLAAGATYIWTVRSEGVPPAKSEGRFATLDSSTEEARRAFASALEPSASGLLGGIDLHLGLLNEAIAELTAAALRAPGDAAAQEAASRARAGLANVCR